MSVRWIIANLSQRKQFLFGSVFTRLRGVVFHVVYCNMVICIKTKGKNSRREKVEKIVEKASGGNFVIKSYQQSNLFGKATVDRFENRFICKLTTTTAAPPMKTK